MSLDDIPAGTFDFNNYFWPPFRSVVSVFLSSRVPSHVYVEGRMNKSTQSVKDIDLTVLESATTARSLSKI